MKIVALALILIVAVGIVGYVAMSNYPQPQALTIRKPEFVTLTRSVIHNVPYTVSKPDGSKETRTVAYAVSAPEYRVHFVSEQKDLPVTQDRKLQFWFMVLLGGFLLLYAIVILFLFTVSFFNSTVSKHAGKIEVQLAAVVAFTLGIAANYYSSMLSASSSNAQAIQTQYDVNAIMQALSNRSFFGTPPDSDTPPDQQLNSRNESAPSPPSLPVPGKEKSVPSAPEPASPPTDKEPS